MKYRSNKHGDFVVVEGKSYRIERQYYSDAESVAPILVEDMFEHLGTRRVGMKILTIGDQRFIMGSFPVDETQDHLVQLSEVRQDDKGVQFKIKPPFLDAATYMPIISIVGGLGEAQINSIIGNDALGSVAQIVQQGINETLQANAQKQTPGDVGCQQP